MSLAPFVGQAAVVTVAAATGYGLWRLRLPLDVAAITLAGVAVANYRRVAPRSARAEPIVPAVPTSLAPECAIPRAVPS
jgi:hypothetical protein